MEACRLASMTDFGMADWRQRFSRSALLLLLGMQLCHAAGVTPYNPASTAQAPCGTGAPPPGHQSPSLTGSGTGLDITVRQDGNKLCYVNNNSADAPVIHTRVGTDLVITLHNEIADPEMIDSVSGPSKLTSANEAVPNSPEFYPVIPGMHHAASGATNLHLHGFAVPPVAPQDEVLLTCTDPLTGPARCGHHSFTYHFHVPSDMPEGLYWYHPHIHGEVQAQMLMGLTGALIVEGPRSDARRRAGIEEQLLIVRQTQDNEATSAQPAAMTAAAPTANPNPLAKSSTSANKIDSAHELLCTRNAGIDALSLNGTPVPLGLGEDSAYAHYSIAAGSKQYWQFLNAATDAFLSLTVVDENGVPLPMQVAALDGAPLTDDAGTALEAKETREPLMIPPAGRLEALVQGPAAGKKAYLVTRAVDTGCSGDRLPERRLAILEGSPVASPLPPVAPVASTATLFKGLMARRTTQKRTIAMAEYPRPGVDDQIDFYIAERRPGAVLRPYMMGDNPAITIRAGTTEEWTIENWTNELHAFHIHQVHFRVLEVDGEKIADPPLLDVVNVPYATATGYHSKEGPIRPGRVRIKLYFPVSLAGDIPFHCHLVDHEDNGMMGVLRVATD